MVDLPPAKPSHLNYFVFGPILLPLASRRRLKDWAFFVVPPAIPALRLATTNCLNQSARLFGSAAKKTALPPTGLHFEMAGRYELAHSSNGLILRAEHSGELFC